MAGYIDPKTQPAWRRGFYDPNKKSWLGVGYDNPHQLFLDQEFTNKGTFGLDEGHQRKAMEYAGTGQYSFKDAIKKAQEDMAAYQKEMAQLAEKRGQENLARAERQKQIGLELMRGKPMGGSRMLGFGMLSPGLSSASQSSQKRLLGL